MKKVLEAHKASLKTRQARHQSLKMRERSDSRADRGESPLFEPEHTKQTSSQYPQHNNGADITNGELASHTGPPIPLPAKGTIEDIQRRATQKRTGMGSVGIRYALC